MISECSEEDDYPIRWMSYNTEDDEGDNPSIKKYKECAAITSVVPSQIERNSRDVQKVNSSRLAFHYK